MRSYGGLWDRITSMPNIMDAWEQFRRVHTRTFGTREWLADLNARLAGLRGQLLDGTYRPGCYSCFKVYEPKPRLISRAPIRDRIVHHALCNLITPVLERRFIVQTYACRPGKGTHTACAKARELCARGGYFLKLDVRHYFESISWDVLESVLLPLFRESEVRRLVALVVENRKGLPAPDGAAPASLRRGLPIGNLTSQWFANFYLDGLDHFAAETLRLGRGYLRYMDDMLFFLPGKAECHRTYLAVRDWLRDRRGLELKDEATRLAPVSEGVPFLGLRIWRDRWRFQRRRFQRTRRKLEQHYAAYVRGDESLSHLRNCGRGMEGAAGWYGFKGIYRNVGEKTLAQYDLMAADDGLPLWKATGAQDGTSGTGGAAKTASCGFRNGRWTPANRDNDNNNNPIIGFRLASPERREGDAALVPSMEPSRGTCVPQCGGNEHAPGETGASSGGRAARPSREPISAISDFDLTRSNHT